MDTKKHYKMYKSGKKWCYAAIATASIALGMMASNATAQADTTSTTQDSAVTTTTDSATTQNNNVDSNDQANLTNQTVKIDSNSASQTTSDSVDSQNTNTTTQVQKWQQSDVQLQKPSTTANQNNEGNLD